MLLLSLLLVAAPPAAPVPPSLDSTSVTGIVTGTVRAASSGAPISEAVVSLEGTARSTVTDSAGTYRLRRIPVGTVQLRLTAHGFSPLEVTAVVPPTGTLQLDVALDALPDSTADSAAVVALHEVHIVARHAGELMSDTLGTGERAPGTGGWSIDSGEIAATRLQGDVDVFRALATNPTINASAGSMALADQGGSRDEMLVTLDGIPLWSPYHATAVTSAISPDVVGSATLHDGAPSAQYDGRLSGTLALQTPAAPVQGDHATGALSPLVARAAITTPLPLDSGSWTLAARHHIELIPTSDAETPQARNDWGDVFSSVRGATPVGLVQALAFASGDRLSTGATGGAPILPSFSGPGQQSTWGSEAVGLTWQRPLGNGRLDGQIWDSRYASTMQWTGGDDDADDASHTLTNAAQDLGLTSTFNWGRSFVGASIERIATTYDISNRGDSTMLPGTAAPWHLDGGPTIMAIFGEHQWGGIADRWQVTAGLRGTDIVGSTPRLEPRLMFAVAPASNLWLTLGYARVQQFVQSFHNVESPLASLLGPDLPVAAGVANIPVAQSNALVATATSITGSAIRLQVDLYDRQLDHLLVVSPMTTAPLQLTQISAGRGHADGVGLAATNADPNGSRLEWRFSYGVGQTTLTSAGMTYHPVYEQGSAATFLVTYRVSASTRLRIGAFGAAGMDPTELDRSALDVPDDEANGEAHDTRLGSLDPNTAALLASELQRPPASAELDTDLEHRWHRLSLFTGLGGMVAPPSWWTLMQRAGGVMGPQRLQLRAGVQWGF